MQAFEFHFNPRRGDNVVFDSFVFDNLCMAGELIHAMPQNKNFIETLSNIIKDGFYAKIDFAESLRGANNFLDKETKSGNVGWLGNLNFAAINVQNSVLNFTKVGNIKILLLREGEVLDISQNLELQDTEPYPMKVFSNTASGKLSSEDKILILTKDIFSIISKNEVFLNQLGQAVNDKAVRKIFQSQKSAISEISGMCLLITDVNAVSMAPAIKIPAIKIPKKFILIGGLILILIISFFLFSGEKTEQEQKSLQYQKELDEARSKIMMAENFIILRKNEKAQASYQEAWDILQPIQTKEAMSLKESIEKYIK